MLIPKIIFITGTAPFMLPDRVTRSWHCRTGQADCILPLILMNQREAANMNRSFVRSVVFTGFLAGTLDILAAFVNAYIKTGRDPSVVLRFIASGVWGREAFGGGPAMAMWGLLFHYVIATSWTTLFFVASSRFDVLNRKWIVAGVVYGMFVWVMMNRIVLPLSNVPRMQANAGQAIVGVLILIFCIGLPISYMSRRYRNTG
jgi:hypothetical protein